jgi:hypothetical protein
MLRSAGKHEVAPITIGAMKAVRLISHRTPTERGAFGDSCIRSQHGPSPYFKDNRMGLPKADYPDGFADGDNTDRRHGASVHVF